MHPGFGLMLATGFYGGHGTAAAVGSAFESLGCWDEAFSVGHDVCNSRDYRGIIGGVSLINWATRKKITNFITTIF